MRHTSSEYRGMLRGIRQHSEEKELDGGSREGKRCLSGGWHQNISESRGVLRKERVSLLAVHDS